MSSERANQLVKEHMEAAGEAMKNGNPDKAQFHMQRIAELYGIA